jgi:ubiquinone/menaquinone biosynthesis C-methylase UbiE
MWVLRAVDVCQLMNNSQVQKLYKKRADFYERLFVSFLGWGKELETFFRKSDYIHPNFKILDAGCGTGIVTKTLFQLAHRKDVHGVQFHAFDITQNMLEVFQQWIAKQVANNIEIQKADVLEIDGLPSYWKDYELIVASTMLEYLPKGKVEYALKNLKNLLGKGGVLLIFITKRNFITQWLAKKWWKTNLYDGEEIRVLLYNAGFVKSEFKNLSSGWSSSILVIEAKNIDLL